MGVDLQKRAFILGQITATEPIRPPWVADRHTFTERCTRCEHCAQACPTNIIKMAEGGFPEVDFSQGECLFCAKCADACDEPIFDLSLPSPWQLDVEVSERCFNSQSIYCRACAESCEAQALHFKFEQSLLIAPTVTTDCTGCGACVSVCPAKAISISAKPPSQQRPI